MLFELFSPEIEIDCALPFIVLLLYVIKRTMLDSFIVVNYINIKLE